MAILKADEIRQMSPEQRRKKLNEFKSKLFNVKTELASGGSIENPGQIQEYKKAITRLLTIMTELGEVY